MKQAHFFIPFFGSVIHRGVLLSFAKPTHLGGLVGSNELCFYTNFRIVDGLSHILGARSLGGFAVLVLSGNVVDWGFCYHAFDLFSPHFGSAGRVVI